MFQRALLTFPAFRQREQTRMRRTLPPTSALILWMLGIQRRFVSIWEWLTACPVAGPRPQISQRLAIRFTPVQSMDPRPLTACRLSYATTGAMFDQGTRGADLRNFPFSLRKRG
ncbi:protein of unknown function [Kyrpidia spormannii]|uniref:Uncharacterized protein n=1 Tax=Kyrpidia spormannii TaxID=2055160 RepID=A0A6F9EAZ7_9BACL|nr:protein of unknown function [Kyrpidia spormannii]